MIDIRQELNDEQYAAAVQTEGAVIVSAGAGSGKTRMLTHRIAYLIDELNISSYNILAITFTNKAAGEMKERLDSLLDGHNYVWVSTFHSMCARILRQHIELLGYTQNFTIYADTEVDKVLKAIVKEKKYDDNIVKDCKNFISNAKNSGVLADDCNELDDGCNPNFGEYQEVYKVYSEQLKKNNALDFDDLLLCAFDLLEKNDDLRKQYNDRFRYIHVDEFQDTNVVQYNLVRLLAGNSSNVFVVGDEDQSIYGWRGADITNIKNFVLDFNAKVFKLERNYRSTKNILDSANMLIKHNTSRIEKTLWTNLGEGLPIKMFQPYDRSSYGGFRANDDSAEAEYVAINIKRHLQSGCRAKDIAILMRLNALTRGIEQRLIQYNIPYKVYGGFKFFDRKEVKDILAYLKVLSNKNDNEALLRIINFPKRGISDGTTSKLIEFSRADGRQLVDIILDINNNTVLTKAVIKKVQPFAEILADMYKAKESMSVYELAEYVIARAALREYFIEKVDDYESRLLNIDDFLAGVDDFAKRKNGSLEEYLEETALYSEDDEVGGEAISLSTIHSAKGMEYKIVFVVGLEEGIFPVSRAVDDISELEEERRLMYVAITRAKEELHLTCCGSRFMYGARKVMMPSRFFEESGNILKNAIAGTANNIKGYKPNSTSAANKTVRVTSAPKASGNKLSDFEVGCQVKHKRFGVGIVEEINNVGDNPYLSILFDKVGKMTLSLKFAPLEKV